MVKPFDTVPEVTLMEPAADATAQNVFVVRDGFTRRPPLTAASRNDGGGA
jgi:hypothetical protein